MTEFQKGFLSLVCAALNGTTPQISADFDYRQAYGIAKTHQIIPLIFYGAMNVPGFTGSEAFEKFFNATCILISASENQRSGYEKIITALQENGLDYCPLKGMAISELYPKPEMRIMGDADILIRVEQYEKIKEIMLALGYTEGTESDHELPWKKEGELFVEFHKHLIPSYNKDFYDYYGDGWKLVKGHTIPENDMFIYLFTHFAKHYRDSGAGIKYIVDFYVFMRAHPGLDMDYIRTEAEKLQFGKFLDNILRLIDVWFYGKESDDITDFLTDRIFDCGVWGTKENSIISSGVKISKSHSSARKVKMLRMLFPKYEDMKNRYKVLEKCPFLLPVFWIVRWFGGLLFRRRNVKKQYDTVVLTSGENIDRYQKELEYVGLDFNFKE